MSSPTRPPLVIGVGRDERGDDGVGLDVARALAESVSGAEVVVWTGELTALLELFEGRPLVIVVDAVRSGAPSGTVHRWELAGGQPFPLPRTVSTHGLSLASVLDLGRSLGRLSERLVVYGVEVGQLGEGSGRSAAVQEAIAIVLERVGREVGAAGPPSPRAATSSGTADA